MKKCFRIKTHDNEIVGYYPKIYSGYDKRNYTDQELIEDFMALRYIQIKNKIYNPRYIKEIELIDVD